MRGNRPGELTGVGLISGKELRLLAKGRVFGQVGFEPLALTFDKSITFIFEDKKWRKKK